MAFRRILIAIDESAIAAHAAAVGIELAMALKAECALVYVVDPARAYQPDSAVPLADWLATLKHEGQSFLAAVAARSALPLAWQFVREGKPADEILSAAREWDADAIVVGTHGRTGASRFMLGSTAEGVVRHATCPVLVVKPRA